MRDQGIRNANLSSLKSFGLTERIIRNAIGLLVSFCRGRIRIRSQFRNRSRATNVHAQLATSITHATRLRRLSTRAKDVAILRLQDQVAQANNLCHGLQSISIQRRESECGTRNRAARRRCNGRSRKCDCQSVGGVIRRGPAMFSLPFHPPSSNYPGW